jgi:hypothetical protein
MEPGEPKREDVKGVGRKLYNEEFLLQVLLGQDGCHVVRREEQNFIQDFSGKTYRKLTTYHIEDLHVSEAVSERISRK